MSAVPQSQRIELSPAVRAILENGSPKSQFLKRFLRYLEALLAPDAEGLDSVVIPDGRCHELEAMGLPRGREGLKMFRRQVNMVMNATQTGEIFGISPTGRKIRFDVHERCRFVDGKLAERWAQVDIEDIKRQLTGPIQ